MLMDMEVAEETLEAIIATNVDIAKVLEAFPKHFNDPHHRQPGLTVGNGLRRGLLVLTTRRLVFIAHPKKKQVDGLLRNLRSDLSHAWNRFDFSLDGNGRPLIQESVKLHSILSIKVINDGIEVIVNEPEARVLYFRDFVKFDRDEPNRSGFPSTIRPERIVGSIEAALELIGSREISKTKESA